MADITSDILRHATAFNSYLLFLGRVYVEKKKNTFGEEKALRTQKRLAFVMKAEPLFIMEKSGPFFLKYGSLIHEERWDEFMKKDFADEKGIYASTPDGSKHTSKAMDAKIKFIKQVWMSSNEKEKVKVGECLKSMLSQYCEFALLVKNKP